MENDKNIRANSIWEKYATITVGIEPGSSDYMPDALPIELKMNQMTCVLYFSADTVEPLKTQLKI